MRLGIIGSSHVGAIRDAAAEIAAAYPAIQITWFAVPGGALRRAQLRGKVFHARPQSDAEAAIISQINGDLSCDLSDMDQIWTVGYRFAFGAALGAYLQGDRARVSDLIGESLAGISTQYRNCPNLTLSPAPYPALRARAEGPKQEKRLRDILRHPERDALFADFEQTVTRVVADTPYALCMQPRSTLAAPFTTQNRYLTEARDFRDGSPMPGDLRHMNRDYGAEMFAHFAATRLGLFPAASA